MSDQIFVTFVRPGKQAKTVSVLSGNSLESALQVAGISPSDYSGWHFTDEDGNTLNLGSTLYHTTSVVCGGRVDGAK